MNQMKDIPNNDQVFSIKNTQIILTLDSCMNVPVEAIVLSANNRLILRGATGMAGWLNKEVPYLHDECQRQRILNEIKVGRGIIPGAGIVTEGPDQKKIIHAVSVDYDHPGNIGKPYASIDTVANATLYAIQTALQNQIKTMAISPMCTRGHANGNLPIKLAEQLLPVIQIQVIFGRIMSSSPTENIKKIFFCFQGEKDSRKQISQMLAVQTELDRLMNHYAN